MNVAEDVSDPPATRDERPAQSLRLDRVQYVEIDPIVDPPRLKDLLFHAHLVGRVSLGTLYYPGARWCATRPLAARAGSSACCWQQQGATAWADSKGLSS